jgi:serine/threonine protein kinase/tetratricopeptide (TPR) repeat protein
LDFLAPSIFRFSSLKLRNDEGKKMIGQTVSHYKILEELGRGGMGIVYKAEDTRLKRLVALKFLPQELTRDAEANERFVEEAQAASALDHPNICNIHEIGEIEDGQMFICMAYYEGETLQKKVISRQLSVNGAIDVAIQMAQGLAAVHGQGIVHRDIKPANIIVTNNGTVKIVDFGLAKLAGSARLGATGTTIGTPVYISPEQVCGEAVDYRTDIWSFGVVLYEMIAGQIPFADDIQQALMYAILNENPPPVTSLRADVPSGLETIISKCLQKEKSARYQRMDELLADLRRLKKENSFTRKSLASRARFLLWPGTILGVLLIAAIGYFFLLKQEEASTIRIPIAVIDVVNETQEKELDGLSGMLITSLEQSRRLAVLTRSRMFDLLKQLGKDQADRIDETLGKEICQQANVNALVIASIRKFGRLYTIDLRVLDTKQNEYLFAAREDGEGQESIPAMLDRLAEKTRQGLKEKESEILAQMQKVAEVTTPNFEAYHHFFLGEQLINQIKFDEAQEEYRQAIALDSTFGLAYCRLAYAISWAYGSEVLAQKPLQKALLLIDHIPEKEKYLLLALHATIEKGVSAGIPILKEMEQLYPNEKEMLYNIGDWAFHASQYGTAIEYLEKVLIMDPMHERALQHLSWTYRDMGQYEQMRVVADKLATVNKGEGYIALGSYHTNLGEFEVAAEYLEKALKIDSTDVDAIIPLIGMYRSSRQYKKALVYAHKRLYQQRAPAAYVDIAQTYLEMGDLTNALQAYQLGLQHFPNDHRLLAGIGHVYEFKRDYDNAEAHFKAMTKENQPIAVQSAGYLALAHFYPYWGKYSEMMKMYDKRIALHWSDKDTNSIALFTAEKAYWMFWGCRNKGEALAEAQKILRFSNITSEGCYGFLTALYASIGDLEKATQFAKRLRNPLWTLWAEAALQFAQNEWNQSVSKNERLTKLNPSSQPFTSYRSAQCYFELGKFDRAVAEVKNARDFFGSWQALTEPISWYSFTYPQGFYLLGKIYEKKGDKKLAIENYEKFLTLWKDADKDLPDLIEAKARLEKLR